MRADRWLARFDAGFFVLGGLASVWLAYLTLREGIAFGWQAVLLVVFWVLVAYLVLPRLHRILSGVYVPDYFMGRTRTADGLLGDPVNVALRGSLRQVQLAMERAGWTRADDVSLATGWRIVTSTLRGRSYADAPVSPLFLFRRMQDFAYQQEVDGSPSRRHHVRFWKCPDGWLLPGGFAVDWLAAGTYDRSVGLSLFTLQVTHRIDRDVDVERDHIVRTVLGANREATLSVLTDFSTGYHSRNGGGDLIETDGDLPILDLTGVVAGPGDVRPGASAALPPMAPHPPAVLPMRAVADARPPARRPSQTTFGVAVTATRGVAYLVLAVLAFGGEGNLLGVPAREPAAATLTAGIYFLAAASDLVLAAATFAGRNLARLALCLLSVVSIGSVFVARTVENEHGPLGVGLVPLAVSVLVLLALSSEAARAWSTGRPARPVLAP